jgi:large subunit ribosomal protein L24
MKKEFSNAWKSSKKPNKQRKFRFNAPLHISGRFLNVHLSKELRQKYGLRSLRVRKGDKVRIMRGQFKKQEGKVEEVDTMDVKIYISKIEHTKRDGTKARYPIDPSNTMIIELNDDDKKRMKKLKDGKSAQGTKKAASPDKPEKSAKENKTEKAAEKAKQEKTEKKTAKN